MKKTIYLASIISLILLISISFAWMMDLVAPSGHFPVLKFDKTLTVATNDVDVELSTEIDGEYVLIDDVKSSKGLFETSNLGPGSIQKYKVNITNKTNTEMNMSLVFSDIKASDKVFYDSIYIGIFSTKGFEQQLNAPSICEFRLSDNLSSGSCPLTENFTLPRNYASVELRFYIRIDHNAGNEIQKQWLSFSKFNVVII